MQHACSTNVEHAAPVRNALRNGSATFLLEVTVKKSTIAETIDRASCDQKLIQPKRLQFHSP